MKASELMIGDWVLIDESDKYAGCKGTITSLRFHQIEDGFYSMIFIKGDAGYLEVEVFNEDLRPIPLTEDILKKNGFEKDSETGKCLLSDQDDIFEICWLGAILFVQSGYGRMELVNCQYIHQLQHAVRLCGIDKEIVL